MPIGFTGGDGGGSSGGKPKASPLKPASPKAVPVSPPAVPAKSWPIPTETVWPAVRDIAQTAVAAVVAALVPVTVEVYTVRADGRACLECGPYDGSLWDEGEGPQPPLHPNCRCRRLTHHVEWRARP